MFNLKYTLIKGDCLEEMNNIADKSIDMVLCDLPYGCTRNKWDVALPFDALWAHYKRVVKTGGVIALFGKQRFTIEVASSNRKLFRYKVVWQKSCGTDFLNANRKPLSAHEDICIFYDKQPVYHPQKRTGFEPYRRDSTSRISSRMSSNIGRFDSSVISASKDGERFPIDVVTFPYQQSTGHTTAKPVGLLEWLIKTYTDAGMVVLDNCMGSGSTGVACMNTGRAFIGIEKEADFFNTAMCRIKDAANQMPITSTN